MFDLTEADLAGGHVEGELVGPVVLAARGDADRVGAEERLDTAVRGDPRCRRCDRDADQSVAGEPPGVDGGRAEVVGVADTDRCHPVRPGALFSAPCGGQTGEYAECAVGVEHDPCTTVLDHSNIGFRLCDAGRELIEILR